MRSILVMEIDCKCGHVLYFPFYMYLSLMKLTRPVFKMNLSVYCYHGYCPYEPSNGLMDKCVGCVLKRSQPL